MVGVLAGLEHDQPGLMAVEMVHRVGEHRALEAVGHARPEDEPRRSRGLLLVDRGVVVVVIELGAQELLDLGRGIEGGEDDELVPGEPQAEAVAPRFEPPDGRRPDGLAVRRCKLPELLLRRHPRDALFRDRLAHGGPSVRGRYNIGRRVESRSEIHPTA